MRMGATAVPVPLKWPLPLRPIAISAHLCPQLLEPSMSDPPYVLVSEPESSGTDDSVTYLEDGEEVAATTTNDTACL